MKLIIMNGQALVPNIEILAAVSPSHDCDIRYADLTPGEKIIYDDGMGVLVQDCICNVDNTPYELELNRMTSAAINIVVDEITTSTLDYLTLAAADQTKLDDLNQLVIDKCW